MKPNPAPGQEKMYSTMARLERALRAARPMPAKTAGAALGKMWRRTMSASASPFARAERT